MFKYDNWFSFIINFLFFVCNDALYTRSIYNTYNTDQKFCITYRNREIIILMNKNMYEYY